MCFLYMVAVTSVLAQSGSSGAAPHIEFEADRRPLDLSARGQILQVVTDSPAFQATVGGQCRMTNLPRRRSLRSQGDDGWVSQFDVAVQHSDTDTESPVRYRIPNASLTSVMGASGTDSRIVPLFLNVSPDVGVSMYDPPSFGETHLGFLVSSARVAVFMPPELVARFLHPCRFQDLQSDRLARFLEQQRLEHRIVLIGLIAEWYQSNRRAVTSQRELRLPSRLDVLAANAACARRRSGDCTQFAQITTSLIRY